MLGVPPMLRLPISLYLKLTSGWVAGTTLISFPAGCAALCLGREKASWAWVGRQPLWLVVRMQESPESLGGKETAKEMLEL